MGFPVMRSIPVDILYYHVVAFGGAPGVPAICGPISPMTLWIVFPE